MEKQDFRGFTPSLPAQEFQDCNTGLIKRNISFKGKKIQPILKGKLVFLGNNFGGKVLVSMVKKLDCASIISD